MSPENKNQQKGGKHGLWLQKDQKESSEKNSKKSSKESGKKEKEISFSEKSCGAGYLSSPVSLGA
ncbi:MAG: hypothetical protein WC572_04225 [Candidatus Omnitrophota bacterium]